MQQKKQKKIIKRNLKLIFGVKIIKYSLPEYIDEDEVEDISEEKIPGEIIQRLDGN